MLSHVQLFAAPRTVACQASLPMTGVPFPPPGDLSNPGTEPASLMSPALACGFFTTSVTWIKLPNNRDCWRKSWFSKKKGHVEAAVLHTQWVRRITGQDFGWRCHPAAKRWGWDNNWHDTRKVSTVEKTASSQMHNPTKHHLGAGRGVGNSTKEME